MTELHPMRGLIVFSITPTGANEEVDEQRLIRHIDDLIAGGVDGVTLFGSTGGIGSFSEGERRHVAELVLEHVAGRIPVMVGTSAITTAETVRLSQHAQQHGASAVLIEPLCYWLLDDEEVVSYYSAVNDAISIPMALYNNPRLTGIDMMPPLIAELTKLSNVRYLKEASLDVDRIGQVKQLTGDSLGIFAGRDDMVADAVRTGAVAWTSGCANFMPRTCSILLNLLLDPARSAEAMQLEESIHSITQFAMTKGLIRTCHDALRILGKPVGSPRKPIRTLGEDDYARWKDLLRAMPLS